MYWLVGFLGATTTLDDPYTNSSGKLNSFCALLPNPKESLNDLNQAQNRWEGFLGKFFNVSTENQQKPPLQKMEIYFRRYAYRLKALAS